MKMYTASSALDQAKSRQKELKDLKKRYVSSYSMGWSLIKKVQQTTQSFLQNCQQEISSLVSFASMDHDHSSSFHPETGASLSLTAYPTTGGPLGAAITPPPPPPPPSYRDCLHNKDLYAQLLDVIGQYDQLGNFLREKGKTNHPLSYHCTTRISHHQLIQSLSPPLLSYTPTYSLPPVTLPPSNCHPPYTRSPSHFSPLLLPPSPPL